MYYSGPESPETCSMSVLRLHLKDFLIINSDTDVYTMIPNFYYHYHVNE